MLVKIFLKRHVRQLGERNEEFYGTATKKEAKDLINEGIDLFHVPKVKDN